jgi:hypothetical protein
MHCFVKYKENLLFSHWSYEKSIRKIEMEEEWCLLGCYAVWLL